MDEKISVTKRMKNIGYIATTRVGISGSRSLHIAGVACVGNTVLGVGKLLVGILSLSLFTCTSALYTFGMVIAKAYVLVGVFRSEDIADQFSYYKKSGYILITTSVLYILYSIGLLFRPAANNYHMVTALAIATFTFFELGINIRGIIVHRHTHTALIHAIKMINFASSLICLVLTQTAILSFASTEAVHPAVNGVMGILMGSCAVAIGIVMIFRIGKLKNNTEVKEQAHD